MPASVACTYYFEKRRGLARGISKCGYSIGGIVFPVLANAVLNKSGWKAMFYMFSCVSLTNCGFGCLLEPLPNTELTTPTEDNEHEKLLVGSKDEMEIEGHVNYKECIISENVKEQVYKHGSVLVEKVNEYPCY